MNRSFNNWFNVAVEGGAVLLAILIAFAIDAMWEERQERERTEAFLSSLELELTANRELLTESLERLNGNLETTEAYIVKIATDLVESSSAHAVRQMVWEMGPRAVRAVLLQRAALADLTSGGLQSVDDALLRRTILEYARALEYDALREQRVEDWFVNRAGPYDEIHADLVGMVSSNGYGFAGRDDLRFEIDAAAFVRNRRYANLLAARAFHLEGLIRAREQLLTDLEDLLSAIAVQLD